MYKLGYIEKKKVFEFETKFLYMYVERIMAMEKSERRKMRVLQKRGVDTYLQKIYNEEARMGKD